MGLLEQTIQPHCRWKPNAEGLLSSAATRADGYQHGVWRQMASGERRRSSQSHEVVWWRRMTARNTRWARVSPGADGEETVEFSQQEKYRIRGWEKSRRQGKKKKRLGPGNKGGWGWEYPGKWVYPPGSGFGCFQKDQPNETKMAISMTWKFSAVRAQLWHSLLFWDKPLDQK